MKDPTRVWLINNCDCRNYDSYWSATFGMVTNPSYPSEASEVSKNKLGFQCMHTTGPRVPYDGGRNFGFLDGHAEYLGYNEMPG